MEKNEAIALFGEEAKSGAKKLCGIGQCISDYECGHPNKNGLFNHAKLIVGMDECPLARYNIVPEKDPDPWWKRTREEMEPDEDELFSLCACCSNSLVAEEQDGYSLERRDIRKCCGCPVKMFEDNISEMRAEAAMS